MLSQPVVQTNITRVFFFSVLFSIQLFKMKLIVTQNISNFMLTPFQHILNRVFLQINIYSQLKVLACFLFLKKTDNITFEYDNILPLNGEM